MKIICTQENLNKGLSTVNKLAIPNANLPILNNILLETKNGSLRLASTNLETGISYFVRGKVVNEGRITIAAALLANYIGSLASDKVTLTLGDDGLKIETAGDRAIIRGLPAEDFPFQYALIDKMKKGVMFSVSEAILRNGLSSVSFAAAQDELRPEISGVFFNFKKRSLILAATDSYRLAEKKVGLAAEGKTDLKAIIPFRAVAELLHILENREENVEIFFTDNQVLFQFREIGFTARLVEGQYPDYKQIIPQKMTTHVKAGGREFSQAAKRASLFASRETNDIRLKIDPGKNEVLISAESAAVGANQSRLDAEVSGEPQEITYNHRYFLEGLNNLAADSALFETSGPDEPGIFRPGGGQSDFLYLIMPIRN